MFNEEEFNKLKEDALKRHIPIIMDDTLEKIKEVLKTENPKRILEIGTAVGYSALCFAIYSQEAIIDTIEIDEERYNEAVQNIERIGFKDRINLILGNAVDVIPTLENKYDIIFIDAAKSKYSIFLEEALKLINNIRMLAPKGVIFADNILYKGYVMSDYNKHKQRTAVRHLREYLQEVTESKNMETEILEIGDGLAITRVKF